MSDEMKVNGCTLRLMKGDITDLEIESFVYYARNDLTLGSGYGNAISMRGGPSIQNELNELGPIETTKAIVSSAGGMKTSHIIHAAGPKFQEEGLVMKLRETIRNVLKLADEMGFRQIAFPAMGAGFYGVSLKQSAEITLRTINEYLCGETKIRDVLICLLDSREYSPYQKELATVKKDSR